jgi:hypothetical protein
MLASTANATDPLPVPLDPEVIVIQLAFDVAVQEHPVAVETDTALPPPPSEPIDWPFDEMAYVHGGGGDGGGGVGAGAGGVGAGPVGGGGVGDGDGAGAGAGAGAAAL